MSNVPPAFKSIANYIKVANDNATRDPVVYYWCLFYAVQTALQLDKSSPEAMQFLTGLLSTLEAVKKQLQANEAITNETVAQAHLENVSLKLFEYADGKEKTGQVDMNVVRTFFAAAHVMDVLSLFGEVDEQFARYSKYAKCKSAEIGACFRNGTPYVSSSQKAEQPKANDDDDLAAFGAQFEPGPSASGPPPGQSLPSYPSNPQYGLPSMPGSLPMPPRYNPPMPPSQPNLPSYGASQPTAPRHASEPSVPGHGSASSMPESVGAVTTSQFAEVRRYTKYALSAIDYEDTQSVVDNLRKALAVMENR